ncbi:hypothetical protein NC652_009057 [Populus alba x Populus x berolinensis]|nr:hypothetical protein NC652_009057 [Populus alba x Populus x berolinensis]
MVSLYVFVNWVFVTFSRCHVKKLTFLELGLHLFNFAFHCSSYCCIQDSDFVLSAFSREVLKDL